MKYIYLALGLLAGFFLVLLLPVVFYVFLQDWWTRLVGSPHSPTADCEAYKLAIDPDRSSWESADWQKRDDELWESVLRNMG